MARDNRDPDDSSRPQSSRVRPSLGIQPDLIGLARAVAPNVRRVLQTGKYDCGLACLLTVARLLGHAIDPAPVRALAPADGRGLTMADLIAVADRIGLQAQGIHCAPDELEQLPVPAILHWTDGHFVVIERLYPSAAEVFDPLVGRLRLSRRRLSDQFSGHVMVVKAAGPKTAWRPIRVDSNGLAALIAGPALFTAARHALCFGLSLALVQGLRSGDVLMLAAAPVLFAGQHLLAFARQGLLAAGLSRSNRRAQASVAAALWRLPQAVRTLKRPHELVSRLALPDQLAEALTERACPLMDVACAAASLVLLAPFAPWMTLLGLATWGLMGGLLRRASAALDVREGTARSAKTECVALYRRLGSTPASDWPQTRRLKRVVLSLHRRHRGALDDLTACRSALSIRLVLVATGGLSAAWVAQFAGVPIPSIPSTALAAFLYQGFWLTAFAQASPLLGSTGSAAMALQRLDDLWENDQAWTANGPPTPLGTAPTDRR